MVRDQRFLRPTSRGASQVEERLVAGRAGSDDLLEDERIFDLPGEDVDFGRFGAGSDEVNESVGGYPRERGARRLNRFRVPRAKDGEQGAERILRIERKPRARGAQL